MKLSSLFNNWTSGRAGRAVSPTPGTRRVSDTVVVCNSPDHLLPSFMVYEPGVWEHVCPVCRCVMVFVVPETEV